MPREGTTTNRPRWPDSIGDTADALYVVDHEQRIIRWNRGAERLLGRTAAQALHHSCWTVIDGRGRNGQPVCGADCAVHHCVERGELPRSLEIEVRAGDGRRLWVRQSIIVVPHDPGPLKVHILDDMSQCRRAIEVVDRVASLCQSDDPCLAPCPSEPLTAREREVLRLLADGLSGRLVADRLGVSDCTVRNHVQHILAKCGAHSRAEAISIAFRRRLV